MVFDFLGGKILNPKKHRKQRQNGKADPVVVTDVDYRSTHNNRKNVATLPEIMKVTERGVAVRRWHSPSLPFAISPPDSGKHYNIAVRIVRTNWTSIPDFFPSGWGKISQGTFRPKRWSVIFLFSFHSDDLDRLNGVWCLFSFSGFLWVALPNSTQAGYVFLDEHVFTIWKQCFESRHTPFTFCLLRCFPDTRRPFFCHTKIEANPILPYLSAAVWCWFEWVERVIKRRPKELLFRFRIDNGCYGCGVCERLHKGLQVCVCFFCSKGMPISYPWFDIRQRLIGECEKSFPDLSPNGRHFPPTTVQREFTGEKFSRQQLCFFFSHFVIVPNNDFGLGNVRTRTKTQSQKFCQPLHDVLSFLSRFSLAPGSG